MADGDTVIVLKGRKKHRVRLGGVDAPEQGQPYGRASRRALATLLADEMVLVDYDKQDRYGRIVGKVIAPFPDAACPPTGPCPKWLDAGYYQLATGMAWHDTRYRGEQSREDRKRYAEAEKDARKGRYGLWRDPEPVAPWDWRAQ